MHPPGTLNCSAGSNFIVICVGDRIAYPAGPSRVSAKFLGHHPKVRIVHVEVNTSQRIQFKGLESQTEL